MTTCQLLKCNLFIAILILPIIFFGQNSAQIGQNGDVFVIVPDEINELLEAVRNEEKGIKEILESVDTISQINPDLALYMVDDLLNYQQESKIDQNWAKLLYYKVWLCLNTDFETEELELLLEDVKKLQEFFSEKNRFWQIRTLSLLSRVYFHLSHNNQLSSYDEANKYNKEALDLATAYNNLIHEAPNLLSEIYRMKGNICLMQIKCPPDSVIMAYDTGLRQLERMDNYSGRIDLLLNKAIVLADSVETDHPLFEDPLIYYNKAIELGTKSKDINNLLHARLEKATYLGEKYWKTEDEKWYHKSNEELKTILSSSKITKSGAYFQLTMNIQSLLSYSKNPDASRGKQLMDSLIYFYDQTFSKIKEENNLKLYNDLFNRLCETCPYLDEVACTSLLVKSDTVKNHFLKLNKEINVRNTLKNTWFRKKIEQQKRKNLILRLSLIGLFLAIIFFYVLQRQKLNNIISENSLKLEALRAQMNPHFISNSLNAIESLINQGLNDEASGYLIDFSRLCRLVLNNSKGPNVSLHEELETLRCFLSLEKLRLGDDFEYSITVDHRLDQKSTVVPALIFQPFVENAIWHGIKNKGEPKQGQLKIDVMKKNENMMECLIEDNGVGRVRAREIQNESIIDRNSWGTTISRQRIESLRDVKYAQLEIVDLYSTENKPRGTRVIINLPLIQKE